MSTSDVVVIGGGVVGAAVAFVFWHFDRPGPLQSETIVEIPRGAGLSAVADRLAEAGVIDQPYLFMAGVMLNGAQAMRSLPYFVDSFKLADRCSLFSDPERAAARMRKLLDLYGVA